MDVEFPLLQVCSCFPADYHSGEPTVILFSCAKNKQRSDHLLPYYASSYSFHKPERAQLPI